MNELQRQSYLNALGLESYVPRWLLPGAPEPVQCDWPVEAAPTEDSAAEPPAVDTSAPTPAKTTEPAQGARALTDVMREMGQVPAAEPASSPEVVAPAQQSALEVQPFTLSIWRSSLPLLVLDARQPRAALPTERLLHNLLCSLGPLFGPSLGTLSPDSVSEEVLSWPLVRTASVKLTAASARDELHTWLEAELERRPVKGLLLMGENAARHFLSEEADLAALWWHKVELEAFGRPALVAPSLVELLQEPSRKLDLWRALQDFLVG